ncbi:MAG: SpoIIE family protein phosphatase, partial [Bacteroidales bacterium]|nr:SpoIIE family protein phosphatase [Bacteroidales bacterium]
IIIFLFFVYSLSAQDGYFQLRGRIFHNKEKLGNVFIKVYENSKLIDSTYTTAQGAFSFKFKLNSNFLVEFSKNPFVTKKIIVNTEVPESKKSKFFDIFFAMVIDDKENADMRSLAGLPVSKYYYDDIIGSFTAKKISADEVKIEKTDSSKIKELENELKRKIAEIDAEKLKLSNSKKTSYDAEQIINNAKKEADSIIKEANKKSIAIIQKAQKDTVKISQSLNIINKEISTDDFKKLSVNEEEFRNKEKVKTVEEKIKTLNKIANKSESEKLDIKKNRLEIRKELMDVARYELEIDRLNAKTKEDSARIEQRESQLSFMELEMKTAEQEIENARKEIKLKDLVIKNKNIMLISFLIGSILLVVLILVIYINYRDKKKINKILEDQNIELEKQYNKIKSQNHQIMASINYGKRIQDAILPSDKLLSHFFNNSFVYFKPRNIVSGDFYWFSVHQDNLFLAAVDCTGHGVPGAFMSLIGNSLLNHIVNERGIYKPSDILKELNIGVNKALSQSKSGDDDHEDGMDITLCKFDKKNNNIELSCANHVAYIVKGEEITEIEGDEISIGEIYSQKDDVEFTNHILPIDKDSTLYMFSDGFQDQLGGENGKKFMTKKLKQLFIDNQNIKPENQINNINSAFENWKADNKQTDDVLIMAVKLDF